MAISVPSEHTMNFRELRRLIEAAPYGRKLFQAVVDIPFEKQPVAAAQLFLGFITMFLVDEKLEQVKLAAVSDNDIYHQSVQGYSFNPNQYHLSFKTDADNDIVKAVKTGQPQISGDWKSYTRHTSDPEQARLNQANGGIAVNAVYPLDVPGGGALLFCYFDLQGTLGPEQKKFMEEYSRLVSEIITSQI